MTEGPRRLPPPTFRRTVYFAEDVAARQDRRQITSEKILAVLASPAHIEVQADGRIRGWGWVPQLGRWLRIVTLDDGETVHNAFLDRRFKP